MMALEKAAGTARMCRLDKSCGACVPVPIFVCLWKRVPINLCVGQLTSCASWRCFLAACFQHRYMCCNEVPGVVFGVVGHRVVSHIRASESAHALCIAKVSERTNKAVQATLDHDNATGSGPENTSSSSHSSGSVVSGLSFAHQAQYICSFTASEVKLWYLSTDIVAITRGKMAKCIYSAVTPDGNPICAVTGVRVLNASLANQAPLNASLIGQRAKKRATVHSLFTLYVTTSQGIHCTHAIATSPDVVLPVSQDGGSIGLSQKAEHSTRVAPGLCADMRTLDVHPTRAMCAVGSEDGRVFFFEVRSLKARSTREVQSGVDDTPNALAQADTLASLELVRVYTVEEKIAQGGSTGKVPVRAVAFHPTGAHIAVILGGTGSDGKEISMRPGRFIILDVDSMATVHEGKAAKQWCAIAR